MEELMRFGGTVAAIKQNNMLLQPAPRLMFTTGVWFRKSFALRAEARAVNVSEAKMGVNEWDKTKTKKQNTGKFWVSPKITK